MESKNCRRRKFTDAAVVGLLIARQPPERPLLLAGSRADLAVEETRALSSVRRGVASSNKSIIRGSNPFLPQT